MALGGLTGVRPGAALLLEFIQFKLTCLSLPGLTSTPRPATPSSPPLTLYPPTNHVFRIRVRYHYTRLETHASDTSYLLQLLALAPQFAPALQHGRRQVDLTPAKGHQHRNNHRWVRSPPLPLSPPPLLVKSESSPAELWLGLGRRSDRCIFGDVAGGTGGIVLGADTRATEGPIVADKVRCRPLRLSLSVC